MASGTAWNEEAINRAADNIGNLVADRKKTFDGLLDHWPNAGVFSTAQWVERVVDDRRNAIVEHANRMDTILGTMRDTLKMITKDLDATDEGNAAALTDFNDMKNTIDGDVLKMDQNVDGKQHNFSDNGGKAGVNAGDGDGYGDDLGTEIGKNASPEKTTYDTPKPPDSNATSKPHDGPPPFMPTEDRVIEQLKSRTGMYNGTVKDSITDATDADIAQAMGYDVDAYWMDTDTRNSGDGGRKLAADQQAAVDQWRRNHNVARPSTDPGA